MSNIHKLPDLNEYPHPETNSEAQEDAHRVAEYLFQSTLPQSVRSSQSIQNQESEAARAQAVKALKRMTPMERDIVDAYLDGMVDSYTNSKITLGRNKLGDLESITITPLGRAPVDQKVTIPFQAGPMKDGHSLEAKTLPNGLSRVVEKGSDGQVVAIWDSDGQFIQQKDGKWIRHFNYGDSIDAAKTDFNVANDGSLSYRIGKIDLTETTLKNGDVITRNSAYPSHTMTTMQDGSLVTEIDQGTLYNSPDNRTFVLSVNQGDNNQQKSKFTFHLRLGEDQKATAASLDITFPDRSKRHENFLDPDQLKKLDRLISAWNVSVAIDPDHGYTISLLGLPDRPGDEPPLLARLQSKASDAH